MPELFRSQYFCQVEDHKFFDLAEPIPGETTEALADRRPRDRMAIIGSMFERRAAGIYHNTAVVFDVDGSIKGRYRKMHIPDDPLYYEKFYFTPGDLGFQAIATEAATVLGTLVCWDQWYPEAARLTALKGAEILFYPTAIGWHPSEKAEFGEAQADAWQTMQRAHAISNGDLRDGRQPDRPRGPESTAGSSSGAGASPPTPSAGSSPARPSTGKRS